MEIKNKKIESIEREGYGYKDMIKLDILDGEEIKEWEEDIKTYKPLVKEILETWSPATNNDFLLYIEVLRALNLMETTSGEVNYVLKIKRENLRKIPSPETITRIRRILNADGIGLPTNNAILIKRGKRQKAIRQFFK